MPGEVWRSSAIYITEFLMWGAPGAPPPPPVQVGLRTKIVCGHKHLPMRRFNILREKLSRLVPVFTKFSLF